MNTIDNYSVNAVKTFVGREGHGYSCNLLLYGKKIAEVLCQADGGPTRFHWVDNKSVATVSTRNYKDEIIQHQGTQQEAMFESVVMGMPKITQVGMPDMSTNADIVVDDMVNDFLVAKKVKADMKKTFTIQEQSGKLLSWKITATHTYDVLKKLLQVKYPDAKIINDMDLSDVIKVYKEKGIIA